MAKQANDVKDYLAVILVGVGSVWGRAPTKHEAITNCLRVYKSDAGSVFKIKAGDKVTINLVDVTGHKSVWWDNRGIYDGDLETEGPPVRIDQPIVQVEAVVPTRRAERKPDYRVVSES